MKTRTFFLAAVLSVFFNAKILSQPTGIEWQNTIGGNGLDILHSIIQTSDGGYFLGGTSGSGISGDKTEVAFGVDFWVVKLNSAGTIEWQNTIGGGSNDLLASIQQTSDGGYILGGSSYSGISGDKTEASLGDFDYWIVKLSNFGAIEWQQTIGGSYSEFLYSIQQTSDGGYILGGYSDSGISGDKTEASFGMDDYWAVKLNSTGTIEWQHTIGGSDFDVATVIQQTSDGGYIIGGYSGSGISGNKTEPSLGDFDYWVVKLSSSGAIEWQQTIGGSAYEYLFTMQQTADGGYILGGYSRSGISGDKTESNMGSVNSFDYWVLKLNSNGAIEWQNTMGGSGDDYLHGIEQTSDGGYILGGFSNSDISGDKTEASLGDFDYWVIKLNNTGDIESQHAIGGNGADYVNYIQQTTEGGYIIGGYSDSGISGDKSEAGLGFEDYWIVKLYPFVCNGYTVYTDSDSDSYGDGANSLFVADCIVPEGYVLDNNDCNDGSSSIHPLACDGTNGVDDNCNGIIDDGSGATIYYADTDHDGYGIGSGAHFCSNPGTGYSTNNTDCNDANEFIHPGAIEIVNGIDDNCNGTIDEFTCPTPANLSVSNITGTTAKLNWEAVEISEGYKIRYKISTTGPWHHKSAQGTSLPISGLSPNTKYTWQIKSFCDKQPYVFSAWSAKQKFVTGALRMAETLFTEPSFQVYPNPATDYATVYFNLVQPSHVFIKVYDVSGKEMETLFTGNMDQGNHSLQINADHFSKGVYFVKMITDFGTKNQKLIVQ